MTLDQITYWIGMGAVVANAAAGVLEAGRKPIDLFGMVMVAFASALGGGTLRDLLLDRTVFWIADQTYLVAATVAAVATFALARLRRLPPNLFLLPDALGLALFTVVGTQIALHLGAPWFVASFMGVVTGVFGGIVRDVLCNEVPLVFTGALYATVSWLGALLLLLLLHLGVGYLAAAWIAMAAIFVLRMAALRFDLQLPKFVSRQ
ncbi:MAG: trimeric intracellular cation channel family protein [Comamonadaceae bacterium]|nr:trimeric intracellular cation channel family protein [Comamonadaceae bacterium]